MPAPGRRTGRRSRIGRLAPAGESPTSATLNRLGPPKSRTGATIATSRRLGERTPKRSILNRIDHEALRLVPGSSLRRAPGMRLQEGGDATVPSPCPPCLPCTPTVERSQARAARSRRPARSGADTEHRTGHVRRHSPHRGAASWATSATSGSTPARGRARPTAALFGAAQAPPAPAERSWFVASDRLRQASQSPSSRSEWFVSTKPWSRATFSCSCSMVSLRNSSILPQEVQNR